ncbi:scopoletin glucosyltransferase-like [Zingiber officinale]|nr:scopoletin glucosyltransferase-like [Zingiber officinale]
MSSVADAADRRPLRLFFIPYFASGHLIPLVDIARFLSARGVDSTILVTPCNAALVRATVDAAAAAGLRIQLLEYPFPFAESGLPAGVENISALPPSECHKIDSAIAFTRATLERLFGLHHPDAVVADGHFHWTIDIARELGIPRITFAAVGTLAYCVSHSVLTNQPFKDVIRDDERVPIPDLPHPLLLARSELPDFLVQDTVFGSLIEEVFEADKASLGLIINSFTEFEGIYLDYFRRVFGMKTWFVGPIALKDSESRSVGVRGGGVDPAAVGNRARCLSWLREQKPSSVVYACFGSWSQFSGEQLREMALGLEAAGHPFLWVVREADGTEWMPHGFEQRVKGCGLVLRGWAPQVELLSHAAVGAFVTHCGWNSILEGVSAGLPMVTWPIGTEQFINEKLVVERFRVGVKASDSIRSAIDLNRTIVKATELAKAIGSIMDAGEAAEGTRRRARELAEKARAAVAKGGSTDKGLNDLIEDIYVWYDDNKKSAAGKAVDI